MKHPIFRNDRVWFLGRTTAMAMVIAAIAAAAGGCGTTTPRLQLRSTQTGHTYAQSFEQAFYASLGTGEYDIVLIDDGHRDPAAAKPGQPLQPAQSAPLRQVVHIRVHWRPLRGIRLDHPSATNAVIDWYVTAPGVEGSKDRLHYQGAAFVELERKGDVAKIAVTNGQVSLVEATGSLSDPVGQSVLSGTFVAQRNDTMVAAATAPLRLDAAASRVVRPARSVHTPRGGANDAAAGQ